MTTGTLPQGALHLAPGHFLRWDEAEKRHVLTHSQGIMPLNERENEILERCNGSLTVDELIEVMQQRYPETDVASDVREFLKTAYANNWIHGQ